MESVEPPVGGAASTSGGNEAAPPDSLPPLPPPPSWLEDTENETGNECESLDLTSFPNLFYLSPDDLSCSPSVENVQFVSGDNYRIGSHQALLGASCQTLKSCLLDPAVIVASEEVLILCPDYSKQDVDTFLEVLFGLKPDKEVSDDVRALLEDSGFYKKPEPYRPPTQPKPKRVNTSSDGGLAKKSREAAERRRRRRLKPLFQCRKCRECYKYRASFKRHSKKVHGMNDSDSDYDLRNVGLSNKPLFRCRKCNECYKYRAAFKKHSKKLHGMNSSDSDYELENVVESTKRPKLYEFDKSGEEMLPCHLCSESVPRKFLVEHLHAFHQIPPCYKCELCSEELKTQQDYRHHLRNEHGRELYPEREKCDYCPKNIRVHERELHLRVCKKAPHHIKVQYQSRNPKRLINSGKYPREARQISRIWNY